MRTKEEIQREIEQIKGFIESGQKELETRKNQFDKDVIRASIFWWNIRIEELKKELKNQPKTLINQIKMNTEKQTFEQLAEKVETWAKEKGILEHGTPEKQALKTLEECGELLIDIGRADNEGVKDDLGDILVTIIIQAKMQNLDLIECLQSAYDIISKRTGVMREGTFVKNSAE